jgi:hypothetical protein
MTSGDISLVWKAVDVVFLNDGISSEMSSSNSSSVTTPSDIGFSNWFVYFIKLSLLLTVSYLSSVYEF